jgi:diguanylate cyclase (GGDEF)-like protein/putative nucleotidyltransferase with HDIG domain
MDAQARRQRWYPPVLYLACFVVAIGQATAFVAWGPPWRWPHSGLDGTAAGVVLVSPLIFLLCVLSAAALRASTRAARAEQRARVRLRRYEQLEVVMAASQLWWRKPSPADMLQPIAEAARILTCAKAVTTYLIEEEDPALLRRVGHVPSGAVGAAPIRLRVPAHNRGTGHFTRARDEQVVWLESDETGATGLLWLTGVPATLNQDDRDALAVLANQAAMALDHAGRHQRALAQAAEDGLTGLLNHKAFQLRLQQEVTRAQRAGRPLAVLMLDLDDFGAINNTYGHQVGDATLAAVAEALRTGLRLSDLAARYGGDEFALLLSETSLDEAKRIAERLCGAIAALTVAAPGMTLRLEASIGVAALPDHAHTRDELVRAADRAAYAALARVLGRVCCPEDADRAAEEHEADLAAQLEHANMGTVTALAAAVDAKDAYTRGHSQRVSAYTEAIAQAMGLPTAHVTRLRVAGLLHDVGKIGVPDAVLTKQGPLTDDEYLLLQQHPVVGARMLAAVPFLREIGPAVRHHHERWDGCGYPDGLAVAAIPQDAAILMVADAFDAMTSSRTYRPALTVAQARQKVREGSGTQFAPHVVAAFEHAFADGTLKPLSPGGTLLLGAEHVARASATLRAPRQAAPQQGPWKNGTPAA